jgi:hypothetical protein
MIHLFKAPFVHADTPHKAWFSPQLFEGDMSCPGQCDPSPEDVIWDGVMLAFSKRHLSDSTRPPAATSDITLLRRSGVRYYPQEMYPTGYDDDGNSQDPGLDRQLRACHGCIIHRSYNPQAGCGSLDNVGIYTYI